MEFNAIEIRNIQREALEKEMQKNIEIASFIEELTDGVINSAKEGNSNYYYNKIPNICTHYKAVFAVRYFESLGFKVTLNDDSIGIYWKNSEL